MSNVGEIKLLDFEGLKNMPQEYQSAWDGAELDKLTGAKYKPILCAGEQLVHGVNYFFIAEQTTSDADFTRRLVLMCITKMNDGDDGYYLNTKHFKVIL